MDGANIGVVERRGGTRFALETLQCRGIPGEFVWQELQGDTASELEVFCFVNHAHTTAAEDLQNSIVRDFLADQNLFVGGRGNRALGFDFVSILTRRFRPPY